jgi:hypothetical protein
MTKRSAHIGGECYDCLEERPLGWCRVTRFRHCLECHGKWCDIPSAACAWHAIKRKRKRKTKKTKR